MAGKGDHGQSRMSSGSSTHAEEHKELSQSAQETASHLGDAAGQLRDKAREAAGQVRDKARDYVSGMAGQAQETWRSAREGLQSGYSNVSERAGDIWVDATEFVRRYPIASVAVAFGIGCLASCALMAVSHSSDDMTDRMGRAS